MREQLQRALAAVGQGTTNGTIDGQPIVDETMTFKPEVLGAVKELARAKPWQGSVSQRQEKIEWLHGSLCAAYDVDVKLEWATRAGTSGASSYTPGTRTIVMDGRISVVTYLQMFAYEIFRGDVVKAVKWSVNLFRRKFPVSWSRCHFEGHLVINPSRSEV